MLLEVIITKSKYKSEYQRLRRNIIRRTKSLLSKGFYISEEDLLKITPKPYSELSSSPTKRTIQRLKNIQSRDIPKKFKFLDVDYDTGEVKEQSYKYGVSKHISESKYGVISDEKYNKLLAQAEEQAKAEKIKVRSPKKYTPFTDEYHKMLNDEMEEDSQFEPYDYNTSDWYGDDDDLSWTYFTKNIVENVEKRLEELLNFTSKAKRKKKRDTNANLVREKTRRVYNAFIEKKDSDYSGLSKRLSDNAMRVNRILDRIGSMYVGDDNTEELIVELMEYINDVMSEDTAKSFDTGFDSYDSELEEEY